MYKNFRLKFWSLSLMLLFSNYLSIGQADEQGALWISDEYDQEYRPASVFRDTFYVDQVVGKVILRIASLGIHEVKINGKRVGDSFLNPVFTDFANRVFEKEYEVTKLLKFGTNNTITVTLGNGFYNFQPINNWRFDLAEWRGRPSFKGVIFREDTQEVLLRSDTTWKYTESPWVFNAIYLGESYDQRNIDPRIHRATFKTKRSRWKEARQIPSPAISVDKQPPVDIQVTEELYPVSVTIIDPYKAVFAFERNIAGIVEVSIPPPFSWGQWISLHYGEQLNEEGRVDSWNLSIAYKDRVPEEDFQTDRLISNGRDTLEFANRFSYKGFQYVEIKSHRPLDFSQIKLKAYALSSIQPASTFESGNYVLNELWKTANLSIAANMIGLPTDCPTREKNGWTGDGHLIFGSAAYNFDMNALYRKWIIDHRDAQLSNGLVPNIVPTAGYGVERNAFDWTVSTVNIPWSHYLYYGDLSVLRDNYAMMKSFMTHWIDKSRNHLLSHGIGDWKSGVNSSTWFTTSVLYLDALRKMDQIAEALGFRRDQQYYEGEASKTHSAIHLNFYDKEQGIYANGTQTELAFAIYYGLADYTETATNLAEALLSQLSANRNQVDVGVIGVLPLLGALKKIGRSDLAFQLITNPENEIWASWLKGESGTLYEGRGYDPEKHYGGSQNHMYFGTYNEWLASEVAGIKPMFLDPAFNKIKLEPSFISELGFLNFNFSTAEGNIGSSWEFLNEDEVILEVTLPGEKEVHFQIPKGYRIQEVSPGNLLEQANISGGSVQFNATSFVIQFQRARNELTLESENTNLYFDGRAIYPDLQMINGSEWEFQVFDLTGRLVHQKRLELFVERVPIMTVDELPAHSKGMLLGRLINSHTGKIHSTINFIK